MSETVIESSPSAAPESATVQRPQIQPLPGKPLSLGLALLWSGVAVASFHLAYSTPYLAVLTVVYVFALLQLMRARTSRQSFYLSLIVGMLIAAPRVHAIDKEFEGTERASCSKIYAMTPSASKEALTICIMCDIGLKRCYSF